MSAALIDPQAPQNADELKIAVAKHTAAIGKLEEREKAMALREQAIISSAQPLLSTGMPPAIISTPAQDAAALALQKREEAVALKENRILECAEITALCKSVGSDKGPTWISADLTLQQVKDELFKERKLPNTFCLNMWIKSSWPLWQSTKNCTLVIRKRWGYFLNVSVIS